MTQSFLLLYLIRNLSLCTSSSGRPIWIILPILIFRKQCGQYNTNVNTRNKIQIENWLKYMHDILSEIRASQTADNSGPDPHRICTGSAPELLTSAQIWSGSDIESSTVWDCHSYAPGSNITSGLCLFIVLASD